jgi:hypothetical protein
MCRVEAFVENLRAFLERDGALFIGHSRFDTMSPYEGVASVARRLGWEELSGTLSPVDCDGGAAAAGERTARKCHFYEIPWYHDVERGVRYIDRVGVPRGTARESLSRIARFLVDEKAFQG